MRFGSQLIGAGRTRDVAAWCAAIALASCDHPLHETKPEPVRYEAQSTHETPADLPRVVNPWLWPRAAGASDQEKALEDLGPYEPADRSDPASPYVNCNAHYWTELVGIAWTRDVDIDVEAEPLDLDGDGTVDVRVTRHIHAQGGILANPDLFGLTRTPDDPRGKRGRISVSTGVLGLREALRPDGTPSGQVGMTCWMCHASTNPVDGKAVPGLAGRHFDYGLLLATSSLLDENNRVAAEARRARGYTDGRTVRARLLLMGPGRQDLVNEFGFDVTVPGYHSAFYSKIVEARGRPRGIFNPVSVPNTLATPGLRLQNWTGSEDSTAPALERLVQLAHAPEAETLQAFGLQLHDRAASRRALLTDLRDLATLSLQQDSYPGLLWSDAVYGGPTLTPEELAAIPPMYSAQPIRNLLVASEASRTRPRGPAAAIARGRAIFADRIVGAVANRQILPRAPEAYGAAHLRGVVLAPLDPTQPLDAKIPVRCADCHSASPLDNVVPFASNPPPLGRCTHCHRAHPPALHKDDDEPLIPMSALHVPAGASAEVAYCQQCHDKHRDFGPLVYSSSRLFPFDADGNGRAQGDEAGDAAAGGIGTEPLLQIEEPADKVRSIHVPVIRYENYPGPVGLLPTGVMWVRVPPLLALYASAPYLHNGSVPTLQALLDPTQARPVTFALGQTGFVFDTRLHGNRNIGHEFGTRLSATEKGDLVKFLESL